MAQPQWAKSAIRGILSSFTSGYIFIALDKTSNTPPKIDGKSFSKSCMISDNSRLLSSLIRDSSIRIDLLSKSGRLTTLSIPFKAIHLLKVNIQSSPLVCNFLCCIPPPVIALQRVSLVSSLICEMLSNGRNQCCLRFTAIDLALL